MGDLVTNTLPFMIPAPCDLGNSPEAIKSSIINHVRFTLGAYVDSASQNDWWVATCLAVRDRVMDGATKSRALHRQGQNRKQCDIHEYGQIVRIKERVLDARAMFPTEHENILINIPEHDRHDSGRRAPRHKKKHGS